MKCIFASFLIFLFFSCSDRETNNQKPAVTNVKDTPYLKNVRGNPYVAPDLSPLDISYFPSDYPILKMSKKITEPPVARVIYSRPYTQGRKIFGALLKWGEPWRLGANEATEIEFFRPVTIQNRQVAKGRYILYCIPQPDQWTIVFNSNVFCWGLKPDKEQDVYKFDIPVQEAPTLIEFLTIVFEDTTTGANLVMAWENKEARLPIQIK